MAKTLESLILVFENLDTKDKAEFPNQPVKRFKNHVVSWPGFLRDRKSMMPSGRIELSFETKPKAKIVVTNEAGEESETIKFIYTDNSHIKINTHHTLEGMLRFSHKDTPNSAYISKIRDDFRSNIYKKTLYLPTLFKVEGVDSLHQGLDLAFYRVGKPELKIFKSGEGGRNEEQIVELESNIDLKYSFMAKMNRRVIRNLVMFLQSRINTFNAMKILFEQLIGTSLGDIQKKYEKYANLLIVDGDFRGGTANAAELFIRAYDEEMTEAGAEKRKIIEELEPILGYSTHQEKINDKDAEGNTVKVLWNKVKDPDVMYGYLKKYFSMGAIEYLHQKTFFFQSQRIWRDEGEYGPNLIDLIKGFAGDSEHGMDPKYKGYFKEDISGLDISLFQAFMLAFIFEKSRFVHTQTHGNFLVGRNQAIGYGQIPIEYMDSRKEMGGGNYVGFDFSATELGKRFYEKPREERALYFLEADKNVELTTMILWSYITSSEMDEMIDEEREKSPWYIQAWRWAARALPGAGDEEKKEAMLRLQIAAKNFSTYALKAQATTEAIKKQIDAEADETHKYIFEAEMHNFKKKGNTEPGVKVLGFWNVVRIEGLTWKEQRTLKPLHKEDWFYKLYINKTIAIAEDGVELPNKEAIFAQMTNEEKKEVIQTLKNFGYYSQRDNQTSEWDEDVYWYSRERLTELYEDESYTMSESKYNRLYASLANGSTQETADRMCNVTACAMALTSLDVENPSKTLQFEDYLDALLEEEVDEERIADPANETMGKEYAPREYAVVLKQLLINAGYQASDKLFDPRNNIDLLAMTSDKEAKIYFDNICKAGSSYVFSTSIGGNGHYVHYIKHDDDGLYINDPYAQTFIGRNSWARKNTSLEWYGYNNFYTWEQVRDRKIGIGARNRVIIKISK